MRPSFIHKRLDYQRAQAIHTQRVNLNNQNLGEAVYNQAGQAVALGVDQPVGIGLVRVKYLPQFHRAANTPP